MPAAPIKKHHLPVVAPAIPTTVAASTASVRHGCRRADNLIMTSCQRTVSYTAEDGDGRGGVNAALQARFKPSWTTNEGFLCLSYLPPSCYLTPKPPGAPEEDTLSPSSRQTCNSQFLAFPPSRMGMVAYHTLHLKQHAKAPSPLSDEGRLSALPGQTSRTEGLQGAKGAPNMLPSYYPVGACYVPSRVDKSTASA